MPAKKAVFPLVPRYEFQKELAYLYARRYSVDELIRSLREYQRYQIKRERPMPRKTA
jgi:hypothetical protein